MGTDGEIQAAERKARKLSWWQSKAGLAFFVVGEMLVLAALHLRVFPGGESIHVAPLVHQIPHLGTLLAALTFPAMVAGSFFDHVGLWIPSVFVIQGILYYVFGLVIAHLACRLHRSRP